MSKKRNKERNLMNPIEKDEEVKEQAAEAIEVKEAEEALETAEEITEVTEEKAETPVVKQESTVINPEESKKETTDEYYKPTAKPAEESAAPVRETIAPKSASVQQLQSDNPRVRQFAFQCNQYINLHRTSSISEADLTKKLSQFANIIRSIINSTDTAVYDAAYKFFKEHRNDILSEERVFQYIHKLPTEMSIRVQTVYTTFRELVDANVDHRKFRLDYGLIRDNMKLPSTHPLLNWVRRRLNNR